MEPRDIYYVVIFNKLSPSSTTNISHYMKRLEQARRGKFLENKKSLNHKGEWNNVEAERGP